MRNIAGGILGALIGTLLIPQMIVAPSVPYPPPFDIIGILLHGGTLLQRSFEFLLQPNTFLSLLLTWLIVGLITAPFATSKWNTFRTAVWTGVFIAVFALASVLLSDVAFWDSASRNLVLLVNFGTAIIAAQISVLSSIPLVAIIGRLRRRGVSVQVKEIRTVCECGAEFKSVPLICSECGRQLVRQADKQD